MITKMQQASEAIELLRRLQPIAKTLHRLDENACNYELSKAQETRAENLMEKAIRTAAIFGFRIFSTEAILFASALSSPLTIATIKLLFASTKHIFLTNYLEEFLKKLIKYKDILKIDLLLLS